MFLILILRHLVGSQRFKNWKKVAGKKQNFRLYPQLVWCFRSVKTDNAQILSLAKDVYYGITIATLIQASCSRLFATLLKRKVI